MSNLVKHGTWDIESAVADLAEASKGNADFFKFKAGQNVLRFLPPAAGQSSPFAVTYQHWVVLPDGSKSPLNCARMMAKQRCAACEEMDRLLRSGNEADFKAANEWKPKLQVLANIVDRDDESKGLQIVRFGKSILDQLVAIRKDARSGGDFTDVEDGFDIIVTKKGEGVKTEYTVLPSRESTPLHDDEAQSSAWLDSQFDLDKYRRVPTYEEAYAKLSGEVVAKERSPGRVTASGAKKPEVLPPARRRNVGDDTSDIPF
jgi:hypothetical protein